MCCRRLRLRLRLSVEASAACCATSSVIGQRAGDRSSQHRRAGEMGTHVKSGNLVHDQTCNAAYSTLQGVIASAPNSPAGQATVNAAEITWARACVASCKTNNGGVGIEPFQQLLRSLGTGGT